MFGKILYIGDEIAHISTNGNLNIADLLNVHVVFEYGDSKILGEVFELNKDIVKIKLLGEFINGKYINGILRKPSLNSTIRIINGYELIELIGKHSDKTFVLGDSAIYKNFEVCPSLNSLFSNHLAIFGNSGSGKSCGVARIMQNIFSNSMFSPMHANILIFDAYGEYKNAFSKINEINSNYSYKFITTNKTDENDYDLNIPFCLLNLDDLTLLLGATKHSQIPIIETALKYTKIFSLNNENSTRYKNYLISKALLSVLYSKETIQNKKNEVYKILEVCSTNEFNFDTVIPGIGYTRTLSECFEIDSKGNFGESVLITDYILKYTNTDVSDIVVPNDCYYSIDDFRNALDFTLISDGFLHNDKLYSDSIILKVKLDSIISSKLYSFLSSDRYYNELEFLNNIMNHNGNKAQIININLEDIDDTYAKVIVKIFSRIVFEFNKKSTSRGTMPFHLFLEEAHRYIQKDIDTSLIGYNIFDRIAKEGRKYGVILNIISQRPVEISETVIAQVSNFLIFKMTHPLDIKYINDMLPNISSDIVEKQKTLQPGTCVCFGSAFKIPMIVKLKMPDPTPSSSSCDISSSWK